MPLKGLRQEVQRREQERVAAEANIVEQEKKRSQGAKLRSVSKNWIANIRKQAEAEKYARQQAAKRE